MLFENICDEIIKIQSKFNVFMIVDSLNCVTKKIGRFIDPNYLFSKEKIIRKRGGTVLFIHHLNKSGVFLIATKSSTTPILAISVSIMKK
ncbi:hypothetical protein B6672_009040 [Campylobacter jejuni]